jgi:hypothetical protein
MGEGLKRARKAALATQPGRRCAICNKLGGTGFTTALRLAGIPIPEGQIGYAHPDCLQRQRAKSK